jgi:hypothetical protein
MKAWIGVWGEHERGIWYRAGHDFYGLFCIGLSTPFCSVFIFCVTAAYTFCRLVGNITIGLLNTSISNFIIFYSGGLAPPCRHRWYLIPKVDCTPHSNEAMLNRN